MLDFDLPLLASRTAMEMDKVYLREATDLEASRKLATRLRSTLQDGDRLQVDLGTLSVIGRALACVHHADLAPRPEPTGEAEFTSEALASEIQSVLSQLNDVVSDVAHADPSDAAELREFFLALSEETALYRQSFYDLEPTHPYRR